MSFQQLDVQGCYCKTGSADAVCAVIHRKRLTRESRRKDEATTIYDLSLPAAPGGRRRIRAGHDREPDRHGLASRIQPPRCDGDYLVAENARIADHGHE